MLSSEKLHSFATPSILCKVNQSINHFILFIFFFLGHIYFIFNIPFCLSLCVLFFEKFYLCFQVYVQVTGITFILNVSMIVICMLFNILSVFSGVNIFIRFTRFCLKNPISSLECCSFLYWFATFCLWCYGRNIVQVSLFLPSGKCKEQTL